MPENRFNGTIADNSCFFDKNRVSKSGTIASPAYGFY